MKGRYIIKHLVLVIALVFFLPHPATAYVPPGAGLSAIGAFIALIVSIIAALFGFLWYPIKRLLRRRKSTETIKKAG